MAHVVTKANTQIVLDMKQSEITEAKQSYQTLFWLALKNDDICQFTTIRFNSQALKTK